MGVIALLVMGVGILCSGMVLNRIALMMARDRLRICYRASRIVYRGYWRLS